ncbi:MAG: hypothetical protein ACOWWR_08265 [Eubacteriales bacterium]
MNWLKNIMAGRYGGDQLSLVLLILSIVLALIGSYASLSVFTVLSYMPLLFSVFRIFSKNTNKRRMENYRFAMLVSPIYSRFMKVKKRIHESKKYKYFKCPSCKKTLRVPKENKKIMVTCPQCQTKFTKKS